MNDDAWLGGIWGTIDDFPDCGIREPGNLFMHNLGVRKPYTKVLPSGSMYSTIGYRFFLVLVILVLV